MAVIQHHTPTPFEITTIDGLFDERELATFTEYVSDVGRKDRPFTLSNFRNGKAIRPDMSSIMYSKLQPHLDALYKGTWEFTDAAKYIMFADVDDGQEFPIHTDTGCEYDETNNKYSKFTVLIYLNDDFKGGNTTFYDVDFRKTVTVAPKKNRTLIFDIDLYHAGELVSCGRKHWIGTELVCRRIKV